MCWTPPAIGLLLQLGTSEIQIRSSVKVGVLSTGNELLGPNEDAQVGCIPDVNRPILLSLLSTFGSWCIPVDLGIQRDDTIPLLTQTLQSALEECDVIISTGGWQSQKKASTKQPQPVCNSLRDS